MIDEDINKPKHYTTGKIECITFIEDQQFGYCDGNVIKYLCRYRYKGTPVKDLKKAKWYIERLIKNAET